MDQQSRILVGVVGAPHGVHGEMRLKSFTGVPMAITDYGVLLSQDGRRRFKLAHARLLKNDMLVVRMEGVADRDAAQLLTNMKLYVERDSLPPAGDDEFYHADLVGLRVETSDGTAVGRVTALQNFGAGDMLEIAPDGGESFYVAFTRDFVPLVDVRTGRLIVAEAALPETGAPDAAMPEAP